MAGNEDTRRDWPVAVEARDGCYVMLRRNPQDAGEWYVAVVQYPPSFRPAPSSVTAPPAGVDWYGPFPSREAARAAAARAIAQGCLTPSPPV